MACVPLLGYVNVFVTQPPGIFMVIAGVAVVIGVSIVIELVGAGGRRDRAEREAAHAPKHMR